MEDLLKAIAGEISDWSVTGATLGEIGGKLVEARLLKERLEAIIKQVNEFSRHASGVALQMFEDADLPDAKISMDNGFSMLVRTNTDGRVKDSAALAAYLFEKGEAAIGKVLIPPHLVSEELKEKLLAKVDGVEMKIHPGTWVSWLRGQIEDGKIDLANSETWPPGVEIKLWQDVQIRKNLNK